MDSISVVLQLGAYVCLLVGALVCALVGLARLEVGWAQRLVAWLWVAAVPTALTQKNAAFSFVDTASAGGLRAIRGIAAGLAVITALVAGFLAAHLMSPAVLVMWAIRVDAICILFGVVTTLTLNREVERIKKPFVEELATLRGKHDHDDIQLLKAEMREAVGRRQIAAYASLAVTILGVVCFLALKLVFKATLFPGSFI